MSSAEKRSVHTDALATLGTIISEGEKRDAIHLAVEPAVAAHQLRPGDDVGFLENGEVGACENPLGIVDPFLKATVKKGQRFWLIVYPRQITSLRHVWSHPSFPDELGGPPSPRNVSEKWIRNYADSIPVKYEDLLMHAHEWVESGEYWCEGGRFEGEFLNQDFWDHYENVAGVDVETNKRGSFFTCAC